MASPAPGMVAHVGISGPAPFIATGLFFVGVGAAAGAFAIGRRPGSTPRRVTTIGLGVVAFGCFALATVLPLTMHATLRLTRPSTTARLAILSPRDGEVFSGDPVVVPVMLRLDGGKIVPITSLRLVPNEGHVHLYLDGSLVSMIGLDGQVTASAGVHTLKAEFVAVDHRPFHPRITVTVTFDVRR